MDRVELVAVVLKELQGVGLVELERVSRLGPVIDADDLEPGTGVTDSGTASA